jgi:hypothetical protein
LAIVNCIIFVLLLFWGIPANWLQDMQLTHSNITSYIDLYQSRILYLNNVTWTSSWKWVVGGIGFRTYINFFTKMYNTTSTIDNSLFSNLAEVKKYSKYIYYISSKVARESKIYNELFPFFYWYKQLQNFFYSSRLYPHTLRNTYLYKYFLYYDLYIYSQLKNSILDRFWFSKTNYFLMNWLMSRSQFWNTDYYYVAPAVNVFPEKYYKWLNIVRLLFVLDQLNLTWQDTILSWRYWLKDSKRHFNVEQNKFFLEDAIFNTESMDHNRLFFFEKDDSVSRYTFYTGVNNFSQRFSFFMETLFTQVDWLEAFDPTGRLERFPATPAYILYFFLSFEDHPIFSRLDLSNYGSDKNQFGYMSFARNEHSFNEEGHSKARFLRKPTFYPTHPYDQTTELETYDNSNKKKLGFKSHIFESGGTGYYSLYNKSKLELVHDLRKELWQTFVEGLKAIFVGENIYSSNKLFVNNLMQTLEFPELAHRFDEDLLEAFEKIAYQGNSEYSQLDNAYVTTNLDILPLLREDLTRASLIDTDLMSYIHRDDVRKTILKKRNFLELEMLQNFAYMKSYRKQRLYDPATIFDIKNSLNIDAVPENHINLFNEIIQRYYDNNASTWGLSKLGKPRYDYYRQLFNSNVSKNLSEFGYTDNLTTRNSLIKNMQNLLWYRYYYKIDAQLNTYDLMPSYQKFYIETWPKEYLNGKYNYYGKINTIDSLNIISGIPENGFLVYENENTILPLFTNFLLQDEVYLYLF